MNSLPREREVQGVRVPTFIYGTAWKEDSTARLTALALQAGFRGIDTANQRRHYHEAGVGEAVQAAFASGSVRRGDLFLQTKFTFQRGQDHRLPYDPRAPIGEQVEQSFASSLEHLGVDVLDGYLLHGPSRNEGLTDEDWQAWRAMEELQRAGKAKLIGVSNVTARQLEELFAAARVKPSLVQNRCFTRPNADRAVRTACEAHGTLYEGFSLLTAIPHIVQGTAIAEVAKRARITPEQAVFRFCLEHGVVVLTGTSSQEHMDLDLGVYDTPIDEAGASQVRRLVGW